MEVSLPPLVSFILIVLPVTIVGWIVFCCKKWSRRKQDDEIIRNTIYSESEFSKECKKIKLNANSFPPETPEPFTDLSQQLSLSVVAITNNHKILIKIGSLSSRILEIVRKIKRKRWPCLFVCSVYTLYLASIYIRQQLIKKLQGFASQCEELFKELSKKHLEVVNYWKDLIEQKNVIPQDIQNLKQNCNLYGPEIESLIDELESIDTIIKKIPEHLFAEDLSDTLFFDEKRVVTYKEEVIQINKFYEEAKETTMKINGCIDLYNEMYVKFNYLINKNYKCISVISEEISSSSETDVCVDWTEIMSEIEKCKNELQNVGDSEQKRTVMELGEHIEILEKQKTTLFDIEADIHQIREKAEKLKTLIDRNFELIENAYQEVSSTDKSIDETEISVNWNDIISRIGECQKEIKCISNSEKKRTVTELDEHINKIEVQQEKLSDILGEISQIKKELVNLKKILEDIKKAEDKWNNLKYSLIKILKLNPLIESSGLDNNEILGTYKRNSELLQTLLDKLDFRNDFSSDFSVYKQRLRENIEMSQIYGDNQDRESGRSEIIHRINTFIVQPVLKDTFDMDLTFDELHKFLSSENLHANKSDIDKFEVFKRVLFAVLELRRERQKLSLFLRNLTPKQIQDFCQLPNKEDSDVISSCEGVPEKAKEHESLLPLQVHPIKLLVRYRSLENICKDNALRLYEREKDNSKLKVEELMRWVSLDEEDIMKETLNALNPVKIQTDKITDILNITFDLLKTHRDMHNTLYVPLGQKLEELNDLYKETQIKQEEIRQIETVENIIHGRRPVNYFYRENNIRNLFNRIEIYKVELKQSKGRNIREAQYNIDVTIKLYQVFIQNTDVTIARFKKREIYLRYILDEIIHKEDQLISERDDDCQNQKVRDRARKFLDKIDHRFSSLQDPQDIERVIHILERLYKEIDR